MQRLCFLKKGATKQPELKKTQGLIKSITILFIGPGIEKNWYPVFQTVLFIIIASNTPYY